MLNIDAIVREDWDGILRHLDLTPMAGKSLLITGASGLIGRYIAGPIALANATRGLGCRLVCVSRRPATAPQSPGVEWLQLDLTQPVPDIGNFDFIFHGACYAQPALWFAERLSLLDLNVNATRHLLDVARRSGGAFLFCSSGEAYGNPPAELAPIPESYVGAPDPTAKRAIYGETKRLGEVLCAVYGEDFGVRAHATRISHLYGPGIGLDDQRVFADFMRQALAGQPIRLRDQGTAVKTLGYVADAALMILTILLHGRQTIYNVGGIDQVTIRQLAEKITSLAGGGPVILPEQSSDAPHIGTDAGTTWLDLGRYTADFGRPHFTPLEQGLSRMIEWNRKGASFR